MHEREAERAARLLERIVGDAEFRARFRSDPAEACREAGLSDIAEDMRSARGKAMYTLEQRESRSSLAGFLMAAAMEGSGAVDLIESVVPHLGAVPGQVADVLSRVNLPVLRGTVQQPRPDWASSGGSRAPARADDALSAPKDRALGYGAAEGEPRAVAAGHDNPGGSSAFRAAQARPAPGHRAELPAIDAAASAVYPGDDAPRESIAAWMAAAARRRGLPGELPVMAALVESRLRNLPGGDADSAGYFQMRAGTWNTGEYAGYAQRPDLQLKWFLDQAAKIKQQRLTAGRSVTDPHDYGEWIADVERPLERYRGRYQLQLTDARRLLAAAEHRHATPAVSGGEEQTSLGSAALRIAETQRGVRETGGSNAGPQVDQYLAAAGVRPGNPWCAAFVTWSLQRAGHKMPGSGWAAVSTWVRNAEQRTNGLKLVSPDQARPGDIVAYDWQGGSDFGDDGHIGLLASDVKDGRFHALEGNNADAVNLVARGLGGRPNIVFIRVEGSATAGAAGADPSQAVSGATRSPEAARPDSLAFVPAAGQRPPLSRPGSSHQLQLSDAPRLLPHEPGRASAAAVTTTAADAGPAPPEIPGVGRIPVTGARALAAVHAAARQLGTPYRWAGSTPETGFDCSGLMQWAYARAGISIPRVSEAQIMAGNGTPVPRDQLRPGDLVFFRDATGDVHHVGMSLGGNRFLHAPHTGDVVKISSLDEPPYAQQFTGARRFDHGPAAPRGGIVDPLSVARAQEAAGRDAREVRRNGSQLFLAVRAEENRKRNASRMFLKALSPKPPAGA